MIRFTIPVGALVGRQSSLLVHLALQSTPWSIKPGIQLKRTRKSDIRVFFPLSYRTSEFETDRTK